MTQVLQLEKEGRIDAARQLRAAVHQRAEKLRLFKNGLTLQYQQAQAASAGAGTQPGLPSAAPRQPTATQLSGVAVKGEPGRPGAPPAPQHATPVMPNAVPKIPMPGQVPPEMAAQMQKLWDQKNKIAPSHPVASTSASPDKAQAQPARWVGTLTWRGFDSETHVRKDVHTRVAMVTRAETASMM